MFGVDDAVEGMISGSIWGFGLIAGATGFALMSAGVKPLVKRGFGGYLAASDRVRGWVIGPTNKMRGFYAEAKSEYESQLAPPSRPEPPTAGSASHPEGPTA